MPQMKPINWLFLYLLLNLTLILMNIMNYFSMNIKNIKNKNLFKNKMMKPWKW